MGKSIVSPFLTNGVFVYICLLPKLTAPDPFVITGVIVIRQSLHVQSKW